jgi:negative regulator of sigma-B (phosphoserine phosphatase)
VIEVGVATAALSGPSGDLAVVAHRGDRDLVCAIDGLGHGYAAAEAASRAAEVLEAGGAFSLDGLLRRCHEALVGTRGAVMTLAEFRAQPAEVTWVGVGNVEARLLPAALASSDGATPAVSAGSLAAPTLFGGVIGHHLPTVRPSSHPLGEGDLVVMATDGVRADFADGLAVTGEPQAIADRVLARAARGTDDALVVVVRWAAATP